MANDNNPVRRTVIYFTHLDKIPPIDQWIGDVPYFRPTGPIQPAEARVVIPEEPPEWETSR